MVKLTNPFNYPLEFLVGGIVLVAGVRFLKTPISLSCPPPPSSPPPPQCIVNPEKPTPKNRRQREVERELTNLKASGPEFSRESGWPFVAKAGQLLGHEADYLELLVRIEEAASSKSPLSRTWLRRT
ncbi:MAG UNVERIFIED_CONTAM: hypothetical protein LVR29_17590 [Microcystis novacekii LVE1205-3]|jgi:hypothetical protein